jgi:uncharacterized protein YegL
MLNEYTKTIFFVIDTSVAMIDSGINVIFDKIKSVASLLHSIAEAYNKFNDFGSFRIAILTFSEEVRWCQSPTSVNDIVNQDNIVEQWQNNVAKGKNININPVFSELLREINTRGDSAIFLVVANKPADDYTVALNKLTDNLKFMQTFKMIIPIDIYGNGNAKSFATVFTDTINNAHNITTSGSYSYGNESRKCETIYDVPNIQALCSRIFKDYLWTILWGFGIDTSVEPVRSLLIKHCNTGRTHP